MKQLRAIFPGSLITQRVLTKGPGKQILKDGSPILQIGPDREAKAEGEYHDRAKLFEDIISGIAKTRGGIL